MVTLMTALYFCRSPRRGPGVREAACLSGAARDRVSARPARSLVPDTVAGLRRPAVVSRAHEGSIPGRLLDRLCRARVGGAAVRRAGRPVYVGSHGGTATGGRFISLLGDAELDEGNIWEALAEPLTRRLGNVLWLVDLNRQSLDRVVPGIKAQELERNFGDRGGRWSSSSTAGACARHCAREAATCCGSESTRCPTSSTSPCSRRANEVVRDHAARRGWLRPSHTRLDRLFEPVAGGLRHLVWGPRRARPRRRPGCGSRRRAPKIERPTVVFAYTIKGYGLGDRGPAPEPLGAPSTGAQIERAPSWPGHLTLRDGMGCGWSRGLAGGPDVRGGCAAHGAHAPGRRRLRSRDFRRRCRARDGPRRRRRPRSDGRCSICRASRASQSGW